MMASKRKASTSKLPSDWRVHMFSDIYSSDEENEMGIDNPNSVNPNSDNPNSVRFHSYIEREDRSALHIPSPQGSSKQSAHTSDNDGASFVNNNADTHKVISEDALVRNGVHGLNWHRRHSSGVDNNGVSSCRDIQRRNNEQQSATNCQTSVLIHEDPRCRFISQSEGNTMPNIPGTPQSHPKRSRPISTVHENNIQRFERQSDSQLAQGAVESAVVSTNHPNTNDHHQRKERHVDFSDGKQLGNLQLDNSGSRSDKNRFTKQLHSNPQTNFAVCSSSLCEDMDKGSSWKSLPAQALFEEIASQENPGSSPRLKSRQPFRQLCVQSLGSETGETSLYLAADDTVDAVPKAEKKAKGWEKLRSILRRKSKDTSQCGLDSETRERTSEEKRKKTKNSALREGKVTGNDVEAGNDDVYTLTDQVLSLDDTNSHHSSGSSFRDSSSTGDPSPRNRNTSLTPAPIPAPIPLKRRPMNSGPSSSPRTSDPSSSPAIQRPPSPLMQTSSPIFGTQEDDTDSDTSSVTSDSPESRENLSDSGESPTEGGGKEQNSEEFPAKICRGTVEQVGRGEEFDAQPESHSKVPKVSYQKFKSLTASKKPATYKDHNEITQAQYKGPYGKLFTAMFTNCLGGKGSLSNVTSVSHVHKGTLLVTELISGKLLHLDSSGRVLKHFEVEPGSEPWCACVTPCGHVAVTAKHPPCVTVWSGNGTLLQVFGCSVLQSPTGLACDSQGNFIVADERTHRVAVFTSDGHFLRYLMQSSPVCNSHNDRNKPTEESTTVCDNKSVNDNKKSSSDKQGGSVSSKTKKRVRINLESSEIIVLDPNENILHNETIMTTPKTSEKTWCHKDSEMGRSPNTPEPYAFNFPRYVCVSASGHIIVSNSGSNSIKVFTPEGVYLRTIGSSGSKDGQLKVPYGVCCDQDNNIYVADHYNDRISVFSLEGEFLQHALTVVSGLNRPKSITIYPAHVQKLFVAHGGLHAMKILAYSLEPTPRCISFTCDL